MLNLYILFLLRFYRLKTKRPLKELMVKSNECGWSGAGIAHIAFVKDLQTDTIVNHNFSCSKFGFGHSLLTGLGWVNILLRLLPYETRARGRSIKSTLISFYQSDEISTKKQQFYKMFFY